MREKDQAMVEKALSIYECLKDLSESSILYILFQNKYKRITKAYKAYSEFLNWQEQNLKHAIATVNLLEDQVESLKSVIADTNLIMLSKDHDLESTKRELAELRSRYEEYRD